jgi:hypothetical protein
MIRTMSAVFLGALALGFAAQATAEEGKFLHPADLNKDQKISKVEWTAFKDFDAAQFAKADKNADGQVDKTEFLAWDAAGRGASPAT